MNSQFWPEVFMNVKHEFSAELECPLVILDTPYKNGVWFQNRDPTIWMTFSRMNIGIVIGIEKTNRMWFIVNIWVSNLFKTTAGKKEHGRW